MEKETVITLPQAERLENSATGLQLSGSTPPELVKSPTVKEYVHAVVASDWPSTLSGGLSVPFTFAALFVSNSYARMLFSLLAVTGAFIVGYRKWADEREENLKTQNDLKNEIAKRGRPEIMLELQSQDQKLLHVCLMNYRDAAALNLHVPDIPCGNNEVLRFGPIPTQVSSGFSPTLQCVRVAQNGDMRTDISAVWASNRKAGQDISETLQFSVRYSDVEGKNEWVTFCDFAFDYHIGKFVVQKEWIASS